MLALYRAYFVYGACRIVAWFTWARLIDHAPVDLSWGGPDWVTRAPVQHSFSASFRGQHRRRRRRLSLTL